MKLKSLIRQLSTLMFLGLAGTQVSLAEEDHLPQSARAFLSGHCYQCHEGTEPEGGLNLKTLSGTLDTPEQLARWTRIVDRVKTGEMPPPDVSEVKPEQAASFTQSTGEWLRARQHRQWNAVGRVRGRRLTNLQLERTLHDLLGIDVPLASELPEEPRNASFATVAEGQSMSHFQLERHLAIVDVALEEAFRRAVSPADEQEQTFNARELSRRRLKSRTREPELIDDTAVVWSSRLVFYGRLPVTTARESGWYRFTVRASALNSPANGGVWFTVRTGRCVSSAPLLAWVGAFEAVEDPKTMTFEAWLPKGQMVEIRPGDGTLKMARFKGGQVGTGEGGPQNVPGVALHSLVMERIHHGPDNSQIRRWLLGNLELRTVKDRQPEILSKDPKHDTARLMREFARRAFRRPAADTDVAPYVGLVHEALDNGEPFLNALRGGYRALLCSPRFLYFHEEPGPLDDYALASRLSYFLGNTMPDQELACLAEAGRLSENDVLRGQVERLLSHPKGQQFVKDFAAEWLDLNQIDFTEPDRKLHPDFDVVVQQSMLDETHAFLQTLLDDNLSVGQLIDSGFTFLNSRLARFYDIDHVRGDELRRVTLRPEDHRGGVLTQGAILKVTANGTTTSPVIRGVWVSERLLGKHVPPPPESVPAIEPDIRGAKTIREMLAKHRAEASCAVCHVHIDPPGFALENYDPAGQWRENYGLPQGGRRARGAAIDASYALPDGRKFEDVEEFRSLVLAEPKVIARNVAEKLMTYGTGAQVTFADRQAIEDVVAQSADSNYGFRSLLDAVVASPIFQIK